MTKRVLPLILAGTLLLSGCASLYEREYRYSAPFSYTTRDRSGDATEIGNYNILKTALIDLISAHEEHAVFRFSNYNGSVVDDVAAACLEIRTANPLGVYAVDTLTYDTSRIVSYYTADINVTYRRSAEEIRRIEGIASLPGLRERLREAVGAGEEQVVLRVYSSQVDAAYLADTVARFQLTEPVAVVLPPEVAVDSYPSEGVSRIHDIRLEYTPGPDRLAEMSRQLYARVVALAATVTAEDAPHLALACAELLYALAPPDPELTDGCAYDALVEGHGDAKGLALAYKALCDALEIPCLVVHGNAGSLGAEEHYWNIIGLENDFYHVDVSRFGGEKADAFLLRDGQLWGTYLWNTEEYPACEGNLHYTDLVPPERKPIDRRDPETPGPEESVPPTESPAPAETPAHTDTPAPTESPEPAESPAPTETPPPTPSPTQTPTPMPSPTPTAAPSPTPTASPEVTP